VGKPQFSGLHFFVRDMGATVTFYRRLGLEFASDASSQIFNAVELPNGVTFAFGTYGLTRSYDPGFREPLGGPPNELQFNVTTRDGVDDLYADLTTAGYVGHLRPFDAFWGSRYAEVEDPDGNIVGFQSPRDDSQVSPPPASAVG
jgi:catechol 2,3-dioxygenase-like lactoylglutathione lyase family enzyme